MNTDYKMIKYIESDQFLVDTLVHREVDCFVYLEAVPRDKRRKMEWVNNHLLNCKCLVKHVGTHEQIADLIADRLHITKIDRDLSKDGNVIHTLEYSTLCELLNDLPEVVNSIEK